MAPCLFSVCALSLLCVCSVFPSYFSIQVILLSKLEDMRGDADQVADVSNRRASIFSSITILKMARTSNARFGRSANALG